MGSVVDYSPLGKVCRGAVKMPTSSVSRVSLRRIARLVCWSNALACEANFPAVKVLVAAFCSHAEIPFLVVATGCVNSLCGMVVREWPQPMQTLGQAGRIRAIASELRSTISDNQDTQTASIRL